LIWLFYVADDSDEDTISSMTATGPHPADVGNVQGECASTVISTDRPSAVKGQRKRRKRVIVSDSDSDSDPEPKKPVKHVKRRWTDKESKQLYEAFGRDITNKTMPSGARIAELALKMGTRTIPQIRTQVHNYISGKLCCPD